MNVESKKDSSHKLQHKIAIYIWCYLLHLEWISFYMFNFFIGTFVIGSLRHTKKGWFRLKDNQEFSIDCTCFPVTDKGSTVMAYCPRKLYPCVFSQWLGMITQLWQQTIHCPESVPKTPCSGAEVSIKNTDLK